jgi:hypothetical protein
VLSTVIIMTSPTVIIVMTMSKNTKDFINRNDDRFKFMSRNNIINNNNSDNFY